MVNDIERYDFWNRELKDILLQGLKGVKSQIHISDERPQIDSDVLEKLWIDASEPLSKFKLNPPGRGFL